MSDPQNEGFLSETTHLSPPCSSKNDVKVTPVVAGLPWKRHFGGSNSCQQIAHRDHGAFTGFKERSVGQLIDELLERSVSWIMFNSCRRYSSQCHEIVSDCLADVIERAGRAAKSHALLRGSSTVSFVDMKNAILGLSATDSNWNMEAQLCRIPQAVDSTVGTVMLEAGKQVFRLAVVPKAGCYPVDGLGVDILQRNSLRKDRDSWLYKTLVYVSHRAEAKGAQQVDSEHQAPPEMPSLLHPHMPMFPEGYSFKRTVVDWRSLYSVTPETMDAIAPSERTEAQRGVAQRSNIERITMQEQIPLLQQSQPQQRLRDGSATQYAVLDGHEVSTEPQHATSQSPIDPTKLEPPAESGDEEDYCKQAGANLFTLDR
eukprot:GHVQ01023424.1.p1 GENE.GHVQ01023424.1~~GHVQ01023424.1.p1  ORF type:complete len:372 (+),score=56.57 GHVQ01023424.1:288-1403(+)